MSDERMWCGEKANRGRLVVGKQYPGEGYAVIKCGNTEVQVGLTLLTQVLLDKGSYCFGSELADLQRGIYSIACEALLGRTGDDAGEEARLRAANVELLSVAKEFERALAYAIGIDARKGDTEGAALKRVTLIIVQNSIAKAEARPTASKSGGPRYIEMNPSSNPRWPCPGSTMSGNTGDD